FSLSATPPSQTVTQAASTSYTATVTPSGGFTGTVALSASGLPAGASASFNPASVTTSGSSTMTATISTTTPTRTFSITISCSSHSLSHPASVPFLPTRRSSDLFSLSATPPSQTVAQGAGTSYTATVTPSGGFTGTVNFSASGLPSGASASFNPTSVTTSGS